MDDLRAKGVDVVWDTRVHDGVACAFVRDNSGNLVEFVEWELPLPPTGD